MHARRGCRRPMHHIIEILQRCIPSYSYELIDRAHITRLDLSFDVYRTHIDGLLVFGTLRKLYCSRYSAPHAEYDRGGRLNSMGFGRSDGAQYLLIYDKALEAEIRQFERITGGKPQKPSSSLNPIRDVTRFELRLRKIGTMTNLHDMKNPFADYTVAKFADVKSRLGDHQWQWLVDSCKTRGAQAALSLIQNQRERTRIASLLKEEAPPPWWNPVDIWNERFFAVRVALDLV